MKKLLNFCLIGILFAFSTGLMAQSPVITEDKPIYSVEQMPQFPGGEEELLKFIKNNLRYPNTAAEAGIEGRVTIRFVVSRTGEVTDVTVLRGLDPACDAEGLRVIKMMPTWTPGIQDGRNVPVYFTLPIVYKLHKGTTDTKSPLLIVDGITKPYYLMKDTNQLKPSDFKSITVLKDSAAIAVYGSRGNNGATIIETKSGAAKRDSALNIPDKNGVFSMAEVMPQYPGGDKALITFITSNLRYPVEAMEQGVDGVCVIKFVISKTGSVTNVTVLRSLSSECDAEAVRVTKLMPSWTPGTTKGNPVDVAYCLPVAYKLSKNTTTK